MARSTERTVALPMRSVAGSSNQVLGSSQQELILEATTI